MSFILKKIIRNDAMKQDPSEIYGWRVYALACASCFGAMLFGVDTGIIGGVLTLPEFKAKFGLKGQSKIRDANLAANIVSTLQAGCFVGALAASPIADKWGRKPALIVAAIFAFIGAVFQFASAGHLEPMYIGRFVAGIGVGGASMVVPLFVSENAPRAIRGLLTGLYQLFITAGIMIAFWINYGSLLHIKGDAIWMVPLAMQGLPAVLLFFGMLLCEESPRFLAKQDRWEEAKAILCRVRNLPPTHPYMEEEFHDIIQQLEHERELVGGSSFWNLQREMWTIPGNRKRVLLSIALMVCQQLTGTNAINYYAPTIFQNIGLQGTSVNLFATGVYGIVKMVNCALFLLFAADSLGRRRSLLWTSVAMALCMLYIGIYIRVLPPQPNKPVSTAGYVGLVAIFLFAALFQWGWGPGCWIYVSEIPTNRLRSMNVAIAAATQWAFNCAVSRFTPPALASMGAHGYGTYLMFFSFCISMGVFVWFFIPETKGISLEKMDELFGVTDLTKKLDEEQHSIKAHDENVKDLEVQAAVSFHKNTV